jgi:hypothetical protein
VTISGGGKSGVLEVGSDVTAGLSGLMITRGSANVGAGLEVYGTANVTDCTIFNNTAGTSGGGMQVETSGSATLIDCTLAGNSTKYGGAINDNGNLVLEACTLATNTASSDAGGLRKYGGAGATLEDTIVANNTGNVEIDGTYLYSHILVTNNNPDLGPLGDYGGPTETMRLLAGSPAIGAGTALSGITTDQRGAPLDSPAPDIGAFQFLPLVVNNTDSAPNEDTAGDMSLPGAISLANRFAGSPITFDPTVFNTPKSITLSGNELVLSNSGPLATTITGPGAALLTISGNDSSRVFEVKRGVSATISGLTITDGQGSSYANGQSYEAYEGRGGGI